MKKNQTFASQVFLEGDTVRMKLTSLKLTTSFFKVPIRFSRSKTTRTLAGPSITPLLVATMQSIDDAHGCAKCML